MMKIVVVFLISLCSVVYSQNRDGSFQFISSKNTPADRGGGECLSTHNKLRALHKDTSSLVWSEELAKQAQKWAKVNANKLKMFHSTKASRQNPMQGENLAFEYSCPAKGSEPMTCKAATIAWYAEIDDYDYRTGDVKTSSITRKRPKSDIAIGHFTQVAWQNSRELGMGIATALVYDREGKECLFTFLVARYSPPGNYRGQFTQLVKPLKSTSSPCDTQPCSPGGKCVSQYAFGYKCKCSNQYKGKNCQTKLECKDTWGGCQQYYNDGICTERKYKHYRPQCLKTCRLC